MRERERAPIVKYIMIQGTHQSLYVLMLSIGLQTTLVYSCTEWKLFVRRTVPGRIQKLFG